MQPTVGRIVHVGVNPCAALIVAVKDGGVCNLVMWGYDGVSGVLSDFPYSTLPSDTGWSWPPRA